MFTVLTTTETDFAILLVITRLADGMGWIVKLQKRFERYLTIQLGSSFKIKRNPDGTAMVFDYDAIQFNKQSANQITDSDSNDSSGRYAFRTNIIQGNWGTSEVGTKADPSPKDISTNLPGVVAGVAILVIMIMIVVGMVKRKRTERGIQWFPEGFALSNQLTQSLKHSNSKTGNGTTNSNSSEMDRWSEEDPLERSAKKARHYQYSSSDQTIITNDYDSDRDSRIWGTRHYNAANIHNPESIGA